MMPSTNRNHITSLIVCPLVQRSTIFTCEWMTLGIQSPSMTQSITPLRIDCMDADNALICLERRKTLGNTSRTMMEMQEIAKKRNVKKSRRWQSCAFISTKRNQQKYQVEELL